MKRDWLLYLVIFSLALNAGTIGTFAYLRWKDQQWAPPPPPPASAPLPFRKLLGKLQLDRQQRRDLWRLGPKHRRKIRVYRRELAQKRRELFSLMKKKNLPQWPPVQAKVKEISNLQLQLELEMVHHLLQVQKQLKPKQRQVLINHLEKRLVHVWGRHGRPGMRHRLRHMPGRPPGPPPPPGPPGPK